MTHVRPRELLLPDNRRCRAGAWLGFVLSISLTMPPVIAQDESLESLEQRLEKAKAEEKRKQAAAQEQKARVAAERLRAEQPQDPAKITLESGLTLADWLILSRSEIERKNYDRVLQEGSAYARKYPRVTQLNDIVASALQGKLSVLDLDWADTARENLPGILRLLQAYPEQAPVVAAVGRTYHVLGEYEGALTLRFPHVFTPHHRVDRGRDSPSLEVDRGWA